MKTIFFCLFLSITSIHYSQSNLTIFNNGDYTFHIMLNGIKQNQFPQKNVTISNVSSGGYALKVVFANGASADIDKKLYLDEPSDIRMSIEFKKGVGKLKIISYEPTKGDQTNTLAFRPNDNAVYGDAQVSSQTQQTTQNQGASNSNSNNTSSSNSTSNSNTTTTVTTTTTNSVNQVPTNDNINLNGMNTNSSNQTSTNGAVNLNVSTNGMNMNVVDPVTGQAINMNVNMTGVGNTNVQSNSSSSTTLTTTSSTITTSGQANQTGKPTNSSTTNVSSNTTNTSVNATNTNSMNIQTNSVKGLAKVNCSKVLSNFDSYLKQIKDLSFESDQVEAIQKDLEFTCLTSSQAYKIVEILTYESNRLDIAKFLSNRMTNRDNASELLELFTFDSNKVEYKEYIR